MTFPSRRGMTLMELVVALAITGMMAAMGAATFSSIIDQRRIILSSTGELERASALRDQIRTWMLSGTVQVVTGGASRRPRTDVHGRRERRQRQPEGPVVVHGRQRRSPPPWPAATKSRS